jgi:hypothetical protein
LQKKAALEAAFLLPVVAGLRGSQRRLQSIVPINAHGAGCEQFSSVFLCEVLVFCSAFGLPAPMRVSANSAGVDYCAISA